MFLVNSVLADANSYLQYVNWDYFFIVIAVFGIIGGLLALIVGIYKTSCKFIVEGILIVLLVLCVKPIASAIGAWDLSSYNLSFRINDIGYSVTTIDKTLIQVVENMHIVSSAANVSIDQAALAVVHAFLGFVVTFVGLILIVIIGPLISWIVYLCTFAILIPKEHRKHKKHRLASFFTGLICSSVIGALMISPLTSICSVLSDGADDIKNSGQTADNNTFIAEYGDYIDLLSTYNDSAIYKTMTLGSSDSSKALDTAFINNATEVTVNGEKTYLLTELSNLVSILPNVISSIGANEGGVTIDYNKLISTDTVSNVLNKLASWKLMVGMIPAFVEMAEESPDSLLALADIDFSQVNWSGTISDINSIYYQLYEAGLIQEYAIPALNGEDMPSTFVLSYDKKANYISAAETLGNNTVLKAALPNLLAYYAKSLSADQGISYLSTLPSDYSSVDWSSTLSGLVEFAFDSFRMLGITQLTSASLDSLSEDMLGTLDTMYGTKGDNLSALLCGGNIVFDNSDGLGYDTVSSYSGLLGLSIANSKIIDIPALIDWSLNSDPTISQYISQDAINKLSKDLKTVSSLKDEMKIIVKAIPEIKSLMAVSNIDITDSATRIQIKSLLDKAQSSVILTDVLPDFLKQALSSDEVKDMLFGLSADDFDFDCTDSSGKSILIPQLESLLDVVGDALSISDAVSGSNDAATIIQNVDVTKLSNVLTALVSNKIINPDRSIDGTSTKVSNINFNTLLESIFSNASLTSTGLSVPSDLSNIDWLDSSEGAKDGEISKLCAAFKAVQNNASFFTSSNVEISDISGAMINEVFGAMSESQLLSGCLSDVMNKNVAPLLSDLGVTVNFNNVTDWPKEATALGTIIDRLNELGTNIDISSIDWVNTSSSQINAILTALSQTGMLSVQKDDNGYYVDKFGELAYTLISKANLENMVGDSLTKEGFSSVADKYTGSLKPNFSWTKNIASETYSFNNGTKDISVTSPLDTEGEIAKICNILDQVKTVGITNIDNGTASAPQLKSLLHAVEASSLFSPSLPYMLNHAMSQISSISMSDGDIIDFSLINANYLMDAGSGERSDEIDKICDLYSEFSDGTTLQSLTGNAASLTMAQITSLEDLLNSCASIKMLTTLKTGQEYSFYTKMVAAMLHSTTLDQMMSGLPKATAEAAILPQLAAVTDWIFVDGLSDAARLETANLSSSEILRITKVLKDITNNGVDISALTSPISLDANVLQLIMEDINKSEVLHCAIPEFFDKVFTAMNIDSYLKIEDIQYRTINTSVHLDYSDESVSYWNNEIVQMCLLYDNLKMMTSGNLSISSVTFGSSGVNIYDIISPIDNMRLFTDCKEYIVYNLLDTASSSIVITSYIRNLDSSSVIYTTSSEKASRIRTLLMPSGHTSVWLEEQCEILDTFVNGLTSASTIDFSSASSVSAIAYSLIMSTMKLTFDSLNSKTTYVRGLLAEEMVAGLLNEKLTLVDGADAAFFSTIFYGNTINDNDYYYLNIIEARGLQGVTSLSNVGVYDSNHDVAGGFDDKLKAAFTLMGRKDDSTAYYDSTVGDYQSRNALLSQTENNAVLTRYAKAIDASERLYNSRLAIVLFNYYANQEVIFSGRTISQCINQYNAAVDANPILGDKIDISNASFEESATSFLNAMALISAGAI